MSISAKKILRKTGKVVAWIVGIIIFLILLLYILIQVPAVQNFAKNKVVNYLEKKIGTRVEIRRLSLDFPKQLVLEGVYFEDQQKDTLLSAEKLRVDIALFKLLKSEVNVSYLGLEGMNANIYRIGNDTAFNYQYIVNAFTSEQAATPVDTSASTLKFHLGKIELDRIRATFKDDQTGNDVVFFLGHFDTNIKTFDLNKSLYEIPDINISGIRSSVKQYKPLMTSTSADSVAAVTDSAQAMDLRLKNINVKDVQFAYDNTLQSLSAKLNLGELKTDIKNLNLGSLLIQLGKLELNNTQVQVKMGKSEQAKMVGNEMADAADSVTSNPWRFQLDKLLLANNDIQFDNDNMPKQKSGMDYFHLNIKGLNTDIDTLALTPDEYKGHIANISFMEQSGFDLQKLQSDFYYGPKEAYLNNLVFKTPGSALGDKIAIRYPSIDSMATHPGEIYLDADLNNSQLSMRDVLVFMPTLTTQLPSVARYKNAVIKLNTNIRGYIKDLNIPVFQLSGIGNTAVSMSGTIKGLPDANKTAFNLKLNNFKTTRSDIEAFLPKGSIPDNVRLPETITAQGAFTGTAQNAAGKLFIQTNKGSASVNGRFNAKAETYDATIALNNLDAGYFTKQESMLGRVSLTATAKGQGFDYKKANAVIDATLKEAYVKGYNYTNLKLSAAVKKGIADVKASMNDRNIAFSLTTTANLKDSFPAVKLDLQLDTLNLLKLKLMTADYKLKGHITADFTSTNPDALNGNLYIDNLVFVDSVKMYRLDSVEMIAQSSGNQHNITLNSQFASLNLNGTYKLTEIGYAMQDIINRYYALPGYKPTPYAPQDWTLSARITPAGLLANMFPDLKGTDTIRMDLAFNSAQNKLNLITRAPKIIYGTQRIDSLTLVANNAEGNRIDYGLTMNYAGSEAFFVNKTSLNGSFANNTLDGNLDIKDIKNVSKYQLGFMLNTSPNGQLKASIKPDLLLNYDKWAATQGNYVQYDSTGIIVNNLVISKGDESLKIASQSLDVKAPIEVVFANFQIGTLTKFANQTSIPVGGVINGNAIAKNVMTNPIFTSDINIQNLTYGKDTIGNILVKVDNQTANAYNADVSITGFNNDVHLTGKYYTGESRMDLNLDINNLDLAILRKLSPDQITDSKGSVKGNVALKGTLDKPSVVGEVRFVQAYITPTLLGRYFYMDNEAIVVSTKDIIFDNFTIQDSLHNKAIIDGNIYTSDFKDFRFDMDFTARNFMAVNSVQRSGSMFYGRLNIDADVSIRGTVDAPTIRSSFKVNRSTDFTLVLPSEDPEVISRDGLVQFVDFDSAKADVTLLNPLDSIVNTQLKGIDFTSDIQTDTAAQFTVVIDERSGDALKIRGRADLAAAMDKSGKISMTGDYEVNAGSYSLSFNFLKRRFDIQRGSVISWTGDPTTANVDITAVYLARTAPIDLVQNQLAGQAQSDVNKYKQKLPFNVLLKMNGELMKPVITFDIQLPDEYSTQWQDVDNKLEQVRRDEAELNKQVFALLLLGRFVGENPFQSAGEGTATSTRLRQTASGILTDQLNKLAGSIVKGVDLNFGLNSEDDYSTGTRSTKTDLTVGVSKNLLSDRLKVSVGSNFELEGPQNANRSTTNIAGDLAIDYQLSKDGRYRIRAYRKNRYEGVIEGQVVETGVAFVFTLDYDSWKEIFQRPSAAERQERKDMKKEEEQKAKEEKQDAAGKAAADTSRPKTNTDTLKPKPKAAKDSLPTRTTRIYPVRKEDEVSAFVIQTEAIVPLYTRRHAQRMPVSLG